MRLVRLYQCIDECTICVLAFRLLFQIDAYVFKRKASLTQFIPNAANGMYWFYWQQPMRWFAWGKVGLQLVNFQQEIDLWRLIYMC